jgi:hypothetical protein
MDIKSIFGYKVVVNGEDFWIEVYLSPENSQDPDCGEAWLSESQACEFISSFLNFLGVPLPNLPTMKSLLMRGVFDQNQLITDEDITASYPSEVASYADHMGIAYHAKLRVRRAEDDTFDVEFLFPDPSVAQMFYDSLN